MRVSPRPPQSKISRPAGYFPEYWLVLCLIIGLLAGSIITILLYQAFPLWCSVSIIGP